MAGQWAGMLRALAVMAMLAACLPAAAQDEDADWDESEDASYEDADSPDEADDEAQYDAPESDGETRATPPGSASGQAAAQPEVRGKPCRYRSTISGHVYDPREGDPSAGIPPGTAFEDLPDTWLDPDSGATKADFEKVCD